MLWGQLGAETPAGNNVAAVNPGNLMLGDRLGRSQDEAPATVDDACTQLANARLKYAREGLRQHRLAHPVAAEHSHLLGGADHELPHGPADPSDSP